MANGDVVRTERADRYNVEIRHPGRDWNHIHGLDWETTASPDAAREYADTVEQDHPASEVRIVHTSATRITKILTGETRAIDLGTTIVGQ